MTVFPVAVTQKRFVWNIFRMVGHGREPKDTCGQFRHLGGCLPYDNVKLHDKVVGGVDFHGKGLLQNTFMMCYSPECPRCFKGGWAVREAGKGEVRLVELGKRFGLVEHGTVSPSLRDQDRLLRMSVEEFKKYWRWIENVVLARRGVVGALTMFHPARYRVGEGYYWSPHWHYTGCIVPSYGRCRSCKDKKCKGGNFSCCDGFEAVSRREYEWDGCIVRVFGKRKKAWDTFVVDGRVVHVSTDRENIFGTLVYELGHAGYVVGGKRVSVVHWFGTASYRRLKVTVERRKRLCPVCGREFCTVRALRDDSPRVVGSSVHVVSLFASDGEPYFMEVDRGSGSSVRRGCWLRRRSVFRRTHRKSIEWIKNESLFYPLLRDRRIDDEDGVVVEEARVKVARRLKFGEF